MNNYDSNEIVEINCDDDDEDDSNTESPIIQLFRRLISSDSKQSTVLTNAQIIEILKKEFDIDISTLHELEGDIYLTIMKKYLKDWPQWDEFDKIINNLKSQNKLVAIDKILQSRYYSFKEYLKVIIDSAREMAKKTIQKVIEDEANKGTTNSDNSRVVLEIQTSRNQLNQLFFRQTNPNLHNTIFNVTHTPPTQIHLVTMPLDAILNWWDVRISILSASNILLYKREMKHELKHILVNRKLPRPTNVAQPLDVDLKIKTINTPKLKMINRDDYVNFIDDIAPNSPECKEVYEFIKNDLKLLPKRVFPRSEYKKYLSKYSYIRYLYKDVEDVPESDTYDLQLEETMSPLYHTYLGKIHPQNKILIIECEPCSAKFSGLHMITDLKAHFDDKHSAERDWQCTNCNKTFNMISLAESWWYHNC